MLLDRRLPLSGSVIEFAAGLGSAVARSHPAFPSPRPAGILTIAMHGFFCGAPSYKLAR